MYVFSVSQLNGYLKELFETDDVLQNTWVQGEVSNRSLSSAGHFYFTLKDSGSQIRCVAFRGQVARWGRAVPENGQAILAHGRISVYEVQGQYQLYVDLVQPAGVGLLHLKFEELRARLEAQGFFDPARKRPLPSFPKKIGVVTSPTGAVIKDIVSVLSRRYPLAELVLAPCAVQGDSAAPSICSAIEALNEWTDVEVIIVARGGGALEDLWPFNEESVARSIYASRVPIVSGVGHETDFTISDMVADLRAPTPSAAAELVSPNCGDYQSQVRYWGEQLEEMAAEAIGNRRERLLQCKADLLRSSPGRELARSRQRVDDLSRLASSAMQNWLVLRRERLSSQDGRLGSLSPLAVLHRGYSICWNENKGHVVAKTADVSEGDLLRIRVVDGVFEARADLG